ncbi:BTAD domain-containing putative transcriptional regulator [Planomonospora corallina]|uniref:BTAD domain-containing putative transcriptional regulator n=1 Tax=Planomonospora corallina TaxID=1806052 RepID=A0ABV8IAK9_9ACTN
MGAEAAPQAGAGTAPAQESAREPTPRRIPAGADPQPEPAPVVRALRRAHLRTYADRGEGPPPDAELVREAFSLRVPDRLLAGHRTDRSRVEIGLAGLNLGLTGDGATGVARALVLDLLRQAGRFRAEVVVRAADLRGLFGLPEEGLRGEEALAGAVPGLVVVESADAAVDRFTETHFARRRMLIERGATGIAELREHDPGEVLPAVLLVASVTEELFDWDVAGLLASSARTGTGALLLGEWPSGTTCEVGRDGRVGSARGPRAGELLGAWLFHLPAGDGLDCLRQLAAAGTAEGACGEHVPSTGTAGGFPGEEFTSMGAAGGPVGEGGRRSPGETADGLPLWEGPEPVRLSILGRPVVQVKGRPEAVPLSGPRLHLLVLLALHPDGMRSEEIRAALWPGAPDDTCVYDALRHLRDTLRAVTDGADRGRRDSPFITGEDGVYRVAPLMVAVDLWDFEAVVEEARTAADDRSRIGALDCAARLCRGVLAEGLACEWADDRRSGQLRLQTDVFARLAELRAEGDPRAALAVLERAIALDPEPEEIWRRLIRLQTDLGLRERAAGTAARLRARLAAMGVRPERETERLLAES